MTWKPLTVGALRSRLLPFVVALALPCAVVSFVTLVKATIVTARLGRGAGLPAVILEVERVVVPSSPKHEARDEWRARFRYTTPDGVDHVDECVVGERDVPTLQAGTTTRAWIDPDGRAVIREGLAYEETPIGVMVGLTWFVGALSVGLGTYLFVVVRIRRQLRRGRRVDARITSVEELRELRWWQLRWAPFMSKPYPVSSYRIGFTSDEGAGKEELPARAFPSAPRVGDEVLVVVDGAGAPLLASVERSIAS